MLDHRYLEDREILIKYEDNIFDVRCFIFDSKSKFLESKLRYYFPFAYKTLFKKITLHNYSLYCVCRKFLITENFSSESIMFCKEKGDYFEWVHFFELLDSLCSLMKNCTNLKHTISYLDQNEHFNSYFNYMTKFYEEKKNDEDEYMDFGIGDLIRDNYGRYLAINKLINLSKVHGT